MHTGSGGCYQPKFAASEAWNLRNRNSAALPRCRRERLPQRQQPEGPAEAQEDGEAEIEMEGLHEVVSIEITHQHQQRDAKYVQELQRDGAREKERCQPPERDCNSQVDQHYRE